MHPLVASSVFHYEFEFIHPFADGNGRMGRLWQTLILTQWNSLFADIPADKEDLALTLNGKKRRLTYKDFEIFGETLKMTERQIANAFKRIIINFTKYLPEALDCSFLTDSKKTAISQLAEERLNRVNNRGDFKKRSF